MSSYRSKAQSRILGTGVCLPSRVVTNAEIAPLVGVDEAWIERRTGIRERRFADDGVGASDLGVEAAREAISSSGIRLDQVDYTIFATLTPDYCFPGSSYFLHRKLGLGNSPAFDLRSQCTGFLYGLVMADALVVSKTARYVLVVGAEVHSTGLELKPRGRDISVLFGDGAGAAVVGPAGDSGRGIIGFSLHADGTGAEALMCIAPQSSRSPRIDHGMLEAGLHYPRMAGRKVFRDAVEKLSESVAATLSKSGLKTNDISCFIFHQANLRIIEMVSRNLGIDRKRLFTNIERYGNTTAASIPIALHEALEQQAFGPGDWVVLAGFGAGYTWGSLILRW